MFLKFGKKQRAKIEKNQITKKWKRQNDRLVFFDNSFKTPQQNKQKKNRSLHTETEKDIRWKNESLEFYMSARVTCRFGSFYLRLPYN